MLGLGALDIYTQYKYQYSNYTISKTFLTILVLAYLKHYDEFILSHKKTNAILDFIARYSFGLFFVHWYWFFSYNQIFNLQTVTSLVNGNYLITFGIVLLRFIAVVFLSLLSLFLIKILLLKFNSEINTRKILGI